MTPYITLADVRGRPLPLTVEDAAPDESLEDLFPSLVKSAPQKTWNDDSAAMMSLTGCATIVVLSLGWLAFYAGRATPTESVEQSLWLFVGQLVASALAFLGSVYVIGIRKHPLRWGAVGIYGVSSGWVVASIVIGLLFVPVNIIILRGVQSLLSFPAVELTTETTVPVLEFVAVFFFAAIVIPFAEEVFFRGMLYTWIKESGGRWLALVVSSAVFGVLHLYMPQVASITLLGAICALLYERSGSLIPAVIVHGTNNAIAIILAYTTLFNQLPV